MGTNTIDIKIGGETLTFTFGSPTKALRLLRAFAAEDADPEAALTAVLAYGLGNESLTFSDLWPKYDLTDLYAMVSVLSDVVASWFPDEKEVTARAVAFREGSA